MAENTYFKLLSIILFLLSLVANYFISIIDYRVSMVVSIVLFLAVWGVGWYSFKYHETLEWNLPNQSSRLGKVTENWRRRVRLFPTLIKQKYALCFLLLLSLLGAHVYMIELYDTSFESLRSGSYSLGSGECKQTIGGETKIVPVEDCERQFSAFFNTFLKMVAFFSAINVVVLYTVCPLIKHYNILYNNYGEST